MNTNAQGCKLWTGAVNSSGYPVVRDGSKVVLAHRKAINYFGPKTVHHTCHNKRCVNPKHLKVMDASENSAETSESMKERCKFGHSLKDAYTFTDAKGHTHRQCATCKKARERGEKVSKSSLDKIAKHLEGRHDQKLHGNWASEAAGVMSRKRKAELIGQLSTGSVTDTRRSLSDWIASQDGSLAMVGFLGNDGNVIDLNFGTASRAPELSESDTPWVENVKGNLLVKIDDLMGTPFGRHVPPAQDRLQRLYSKFQSVGRRKDRASEVVVRLPWGGRPQPRDAEAIFQSGLSDATYVLPDGSTRRIHVNHESFPVEGTQAIERAISRAYGYYNWKQYEELNPGTTYGQAIKIFKENPKAFPKLPKQWVNQAVDDGFAWGSAHVSGFQYYVDDKPVRQRSAVPESELAGMLRSQREEGISKAATRDYAELAPPMRQIMVELHALDEVKVAKHLLGRHDQKTHGRHARSDHDLIRSVKGRINLVLDETRRDSTLANMVTGRRFQHQHGIDFDTALDHATRVAEMVRGQELSPTQRTNLRIGLRRGDVDVEEMESFLHRYSQLTGEDRDAFIQAIRADRRDLQGKDDVPPPDREIIDRNQLAIQIEGGKEIGRRGRKKQADALTQSALARRLEEVEDTDFYREVSPDIAKRMSEGFAIIDKHLMGRHDQKKHGRDKHTRSQHMKPFANPKGVMQRYANTAVQEPLTSGLNDAGQRRRAKARQAYHRSGGQSPDGTGLMDALRRHGDATGEANEAWVREIGNIHRERNRKFNREKDSDGLVLAALHRAGFERDGDLSWAELGMGFTLVTGTWRASRIRPGSISNARTVWRGGQGVDASNPSRPMAEMSEALTIRGKDGGAPNVTEFFERYNVEQDALMGEIDAPPGLPAALRLGNDYKPESIKTYGDVASRMRELNPDLDVSASNDAAHWNSAAYHGVVGNHNDSALLQYRAKEVFGLEDATTSHFISERSLLQRLRFTEGALVRQKRTSTSGGFSSRKGFAQNADPKVMNTYLRSQYDVTQEHLAKSGVDQFHLVRGMKLTEAQLQQMGVTPTKVDDIRRARETPSFDPATLWTKGEVDLQPISSFTHSPSVAMQYASGITPGNTAAGKTYAVIVRTRAPRSRIFATQSTNQRLREHNSLETLLLGGKTEMEIIAFDPAEMGQMRGLSSWQDLWLRTANEAELADVW